jgi:tryptophan-rich sensory protein
LSSYAINALQGKVTQNSKHQPSSLLYNVSMSKLSRLITAILVCEGIGLISTPFTISAIQNWYRYLNKPSFSPPNWVFGPVWTVLYFMMGVSAYLIWVKGLKNKKVKVALIYFLIQLFLNFIWSILFFGLRSPLLALIDIIILWSMIVLTIRKFITISKPASYLLVPYLTWVSFATLLNFSITVLNP